MEAKAGAAAPVLKTERLTLRGHGLEDYKKTVSLWGDARVTRYISGKPSSPSESWARMMNYAGHWALLGFGYWLVEESESGRFVGEVGLADFKRDIKPDFEGAPEAGWVLTPSAHGKGYATEAVRAALTWGEETLGMKRSVCILDPQNDASVRVADKCGFTFFTETEFMGDRVVLMERLGKF
ncbi:GNAT family N-acetyltransferase [Pelagibius litoralis]|uniref:GNAT family N-acetyltransferase n=1 Tax=Pelagibius litoralis TaxID=374515 RepID=A0A967K9Q5_9PROT|nr:GNAT family N-acetyltransferase [Pelagibius litoralis]